MSDIYANYLVTIVYKLPVLWVTKIPGALHGRLEAELTENDSTDIVHSRSVHNADYMLNQMLSWYTYFALQQYASNMNMKFSMPQGRSQWF